MADLDRDRIAAAALTLLDARGLDGFTMRGVADALGVTPMALYHHVKDKSALAALVVEAASREHPLPPPTGNWRADLAAMAAWSRKTTLAHPAVGRLRGAYRIWTPDILRMTDRWLSLWQQSGLPLDAAVRAGAISSLAIIGLVDQELALADRAPPDPALLDWLPSVRAAFDAVYDRDADFRLAVTALIDGLYAQLRR